MVHVTGLVTPVGVTVRVPETETEDHPAGHVELPLIAYPVPLPPVIDDELEAGFNVPPVFKNVSAAGVAVSGG